jgi:hypothetical protein
MKLVFEELDAGTNLGSDCGRRMERSRDGRHESGRREGGVGERCKQSPSHEQGRRG